MYNEVILCRETNMDYSQSRGLRRKALEKLALLSATSPDKSRQNGDLDRLYKLAPEHQEKNINLQNGVSDGKTLLGGVPMVSLSPCCVSLHLF